MTSLITSKKCSFFNTFAVLLLKLSCTGQQVQRVEVHYSASRGHAFMLAAQVLGPTVTGYTSRM
ncbi:hypothetical protein DPMN_080341 [Dreissena polymorpha]|uniref:Secreted protein n=1 Tax=Dreissena polymorpha TaxID=45954 RepID=A0A9D4BRP6_DREPO|nr:hypothetical protein DPMN_080341 [Dreissena polymorpha]